MSCRERLLRLVREAQRVGQSHTHSSAPPEEEELRALLRRREELRARLRSARRQRQRRRLFSQAFPPLPGEREAQETAQGRGALRAYLKRVRRGRMGRDAVVAHRLSGRSVFRHSEGVTGVRYDTFHNGAAALGMMMLLSF